MPRPVGPPDPGVPRALGLFRERIGRMARMHVHRENDGTRAVIPGPAEGRSPESRTKNGAMRSDEDGVSEALDSGLALTRAPE